jgi:hypothetical protein
MLVVFPSARNISLFENYYPALLHCQFNTTHMYPLNTVLRLAQKCLQPVLIKEICTYACYEGLSRSAGILGRYELKGSRLTRLVLVAAYFIHCS